MLKQSVRCEESGPPIQDVLLPSLIWSGDEAKKPGSRRSSTRGKPRVRPPRIRELRPSVVVVPKATGVIRGLHAREDSFTTVRNESHETGNSLPSEYDERRNYSLGCTFALSVFPSAPSQIL
jgi:hypothetical protein